MKDYKQLESEVVFDFEENDKFINKGMLYKSLMLVKL